MFRLLVIDNDLALHEKIAPWLKHGGYEVEFAVTGRQGLRLLDKKKFDLLITEIIMPEKDGIETISAIRKSGGTLPIIAISGGGRIGASYYLELARWFGANRTLPKPLNGAVLLPVVHELVGKEGRNNGATVGCGCA